MMPPDHCSKYTSFCCCCFLFFVFVEEAEDRVQKHTLALTWPLFSKKKKKKKKKKREKARKKSKIKAKVNKKN